MPAFAGEVHGKSRTEKGKRSPCPASKGAGVQGNPLRTARGRLKNVRLNCLLRSRGCESLRPSNGVFGIRPVATRRAHAAGRGEGEALAEDVAARLAGYVAAQMEHLIEGDEPAQEWAA